jgi:hypothetical protein
MAVERLPKPLFVSKLGKFYAGDSERLIAGPLKRLRGKVQLVLTSPPFPLNRKKRYGNKQGAEYREWFGRVGQQLSELLTDDGSLVIEMGNSWLPGRPVQSLLHMQCLMDLADEERTGLRLCQQFVCYNPSRLPSPAQWVTVERTRVTDAFTHIWWFAKTDNPKANNKNVLRPYSGAMKSLLARRSYNSGKRPSQHKISRVGFLSDNGGSISHNLFEMQPLTNHPPRLPNVMRLANTTSTDSFLEECRRRGLTPHPARMQAEMAAFFISFLTDQNDLVFDPFAGTNTTGFAAEALRRRWIAVEISREYGKQARIRASGAKVRKRK